MRLGYCLALLLTSGILSGSKLYLKGRVIDTSPAAQDAASTAPMTLSATPIHLLAQFDHVPDDADLQNLIERGAVISGYVHENAVMISMKDPGRLADAGLVWIGVLEASDKISTLLADEGTGEPRPILVEFHLDVALDDARRVITDSGLAFIDNPDAGPHRLLLMADPGQIAGLALRDEVAYLFPASDDLITGRPVIACAGALTAAGAAGQYIPRIGDGWGGPDHKAAALGYYFSRITAQLPSDTVQSEVLRAFAEWSKYVQVTFTSASAADAQRSIKVLFAGGDHGDGYPFDGRAGALAHTFYPSPPNPEPLAGDMHFDDDERWQVGANTDLFSVALHETGHALGLGHSDTPGAVMYPYYSRVTGLTADDVAAVKSLYPSQDGASGPATPSNPSPATPDTPPAAPTPAPLTLDIASVPLTTTAGSLSLTGTSAGGTGTRTVSWSTNRGRSGVAQGSAIWSAQVPLLTGANDITVTAVDSQSQSTSRTVSVARQAAAAAPVSIEITSPLATGILKINIPVYSVRGTAAHSSGIKSVSWSSDRGAAGQAVGLSTWDTGPIALQSGTNTLTVRATANDGSSAARTLVVSYSSGTADNTAPSITITYPASATSTSSSGTIVLRGTASDNVGVVSVTWATSAGSSGAASGTTSWTAGPIPLISGYNSVQIRAADAAGNSAWRVVGITRK